MSGVWAKAGANSNIARKTIFHASPALSSSRATRPSSTRANRSTSVRLGRDLNVRYVLEGSVQRSGERMRVNVQLIEATTGAHLWAERFDKPVAELFEMQDEIVARIANELSTQIFNVEARRAEKASNPDVLDYWFRGHDWINKGVNPESLANARECFERARAIDPGNIKAILGVVLTDVVSTRMRPDEGDSERIASAEALTLQALATEPRNALLGAHFPFLQTRQPGRRRV
jgi:hypothetical protein